MEPNTRAQMSSPLRLLTIAVIVTELALAWLGWQIYHSYLDIGTQRDRSSLAAELRTTILHLDEVLTMSARMAAATGDPRWEERYRDHEPQLDRAIKRAITLVPEVSRGESATRTDACRFPASLLVVWSQITSDLTNCWRSSRRLTQNR